MLKLNSANIFDEIQKYLSQILVRKMLKINFQDFNIILLIE